MTEQLTKCCVPLQKLRVKLRTCKKVQVVNYWNSLLIVPFPDRYLLVPFCIDYPVKR